MATRTIEKKVYSSYKIIINYKNLDNNAPLVSVYEGVRLTDLAIEIERFYTKNTVWVNSYELIVYNANGDVIGTCSNSGVNASANLFECMEMLDPKVGYADFDSARD